VGGVVEGPRGSLSTERDAAVSRIRDAYAEGAIAHEALDPLLDSVLGARTSAEILRAVDSLPVPSAGRALDIVAINGTIRREGVWRVPRTVRIEAEYGKVRLDFSRAVFEAPVVDIELQLRFGSAKVTVPRGASVDLDGLQTAWKQPRYTPPTGAPADGVVIRVTGFMEYGRLTVRHRG
jgi:hypothetical protein